ncbi:MAG: protein kinase [Saprospiraceae bacterium]|nr:protein kinase [Saprospiraceae bacterium]
METPFLTLGMPTLLIDSDTGISAHAGSDELSLGDFKVLKRLQGGMGEVLICQYDDGTRIALKSFQKQFYFDYKIRLLFYNEVKSWSMLSGLPHIMPLMGVTEIDNRLFVMMPAIDMEQPGAGTLRTLLNSNTYSPEQFLLYICQIIRGLSVANHRFHHVVHGDLKPENILIQGESLFISDFGLAKVKNHTDKILASDTTWAYKAPELWAPEGEYSVQSDMYALGIIMYECLFGSLNLPARSKEAFEQFHLHGEWPFDVNAIVDTEMLHIIKWCVQKDPLKRPRDYKELNDFFMEFILQKHPGLYLDVIQQMYYSTSMYESFQIMIKPGVAKALYKIGEYGPALEALQSIDVKHLDKFQLAFLGNLLSLNNQDEQALTIFDRAIAAGMEGDDLYSCLSDKALSYKRLKRFDEARDAYFELIDKVPDTNKDLLAKVYSNLGSLYIHSKAYKAGIDVLWTLVTKHGIYNATAFGNMGICYAQLHESELAVEHFSRSLQLSPSPEVQTLMARELMFLFRIKEAREQLELAFDQGFESRDMIVSMLACFMMLREEESLQGLIYGIRNNIGEQHLQGFVDEADRLIKAIKEKYQNQAQKTEPAPRAVAETPAPKVLISDQPTEKRYTGRPLVQFPFLNIRLYDGGTYSVDYYDYIDENFIVSLFTLTLETDEKLAQMKEGAQLSTHPFYITECPTCASTILTNRNQGKELNCRACNTPFHTSAATKPIYDDIVGRVHQALGRNFVKAEQAYMAFFIDLKDNYDQDYLNKICALFGFQPMDLNSDLFDACFYHLSQTRPHFGKSGLGAYFQAFNGQEYLHSDETPFDIKELLKEITYYYPRLESLSTIVRQEDVDYITNMMLDNYQDTRRISRKTPQDYALLLGYAKRKRPLQEFNEIADAFLLDFPQNMDAWYQFALKNYQASDFPKAIEWLEKTFRADPTHLQAAMYLYQCYQQTGDEKNAAKYLALLQRAGLLL